MLSAGKRITEAHDRLVRVSAEYLYSRIKSPTPELASQVRRLRLVHNLDKNQYNRLKRELPYVVCASFTPEYRKGENFASTDRFIVDLDHLSAQGCNVAELKSRLCRDPRVLMCFVSPGGDGLKLLFALKEKCYDAGVFSMFYRKFVQRFAEEYNLVEIIDTRTCDVCRACFISHDPEVYYNPGCEPVGLDEYVDQGDVLTSRKKAEEKPASAAAASSVPEPAQKEDSQAASHDPDAEIMKRIHAQLKSLKRREYPRNDFYVPSEIETVMEGLRNVIGESGVTIQEERNIQYGKQLSLQCELRRAELNIFFGRRGFTVVEQPRRGTSPQLNSMMGELVRVYLSSLNN